MKTKPKKQHGKIEKNYGQTENTQLKRQTITKELLFPEHFFGVLENSKIVYNINMFYVIYTTCISII